MNRLHPVERLYNDYVAASDAAARGRDRGRMLDIEKQLCAELARAQGHVTIRNAVFSLSVTIIDGQRLEYFKVVVREERRFSDVECTFPRRSTDVPDVIPLSAQRWRDPRSTGRATL